MHDLEKISIIIEDINMYLENDSFPFLRILLRRAAVLQGLFCEIRRCVMKRFLIPMDRTDKMVIVVELVVLVMIVFLTWAAWPPIRQHKHDDPMIVKIETAVRDFEKNCKKIRRETDPQIIEGFAAIMYYEDELNRPCREPSREEVLRELDKLWK